MRRRKTKQPNRSNHLKKPKIKFDAFGDLHLILKYVKVECEEILGEQTEASQRISVPETFLKATLSVLHQLPGLTGEQMRLILYEALKNIEPVSAFSLFG